MARIGRSRPARAYRIRTSEQFYLSTTTPVPVALPVQALFPAPAVAISPTPSALAVAGPTFVLPVRAVSVNPGALNIGVTFTPSFVEIPASPSALQVSAAFAGVSPLINATVVAGLTADLPPPTVTLTVPGPASVGALTLLSAPVISGSGNVDVHPAALSVAVTFTGPTATCATAPSALHMIATLSAAAASVNANPSPHTVQATSNEPQATVTIAPVVFASVAASFPAPAITLTAGAAALSQSPVTAAAAFSGPAVLGGNATVVPPAAGFAASLPAPLASGLIAIPVVPNWMSNGQYIHLLYESYPAVADFYFNTPNAFSIGNTSNSNPVQDGFASVPVLRYTAYTQFLADINNNAISGFFGWVLYDLEDWGASPPPQPPSQAEVDNPWEYMGYFTTLAHENGLQVILAPAQDLGNDATSVNPKEAGETDQAWYIRTNIAGTAAGTGADIVEIQDQNNTATLSEYDSFYFNALTQVQAASTTCQLWCGLSTTYGTAAQMLAAYESLLGWCDGIWMNASNTTIALMDSFMASIPVNPPSFAAAAVFAAPNVTAAPQPSAFDATAGLPAPTVVIQVNASVSPSALHVTASLPAAAVGLGAIPGPLRGYALLNCFDQLEDEAYAGLMDEAYGPLLEEDLDDVVTVVATSLSSPGAAAVIPQPVLTATAFPSALALASAFPVAAVSPGATSLHASATLQTVAPQGPPAGALHAVATFAAVAPAPAVAAASFAATLPTPTLTLTVTSVTALDVVATLRAPGVPAVTPAAAAVTFTSAVVAVTAAPSALDAVASFPASAPAVRPLAGVLAQPGAAFLTPVVSGQGSPVAVTPLALDAAAALALVAVTCSALPAVLAATATFGTPTVVISSTDATPGAFVATPFIPVPALAVTVSPAALSVTATVPVPAAKDAGSPAPLHCAASFPAPAPASRSFPAALNAASNFHVPAVTTSAAPAALDATVTVSGPAASVTAIPAPLDATAALTPPSGVFIYPAAAQFTVSFPAAVRKVTKPAGTLHASVTIPASRPGGQPPPVAGYVTFPAAAVSAVAAPFGPWCFATTEQDANQFGGAWTHGNTYGGLWVETNLYGGTESDANPYLGLGIFGYGGSANSGMYNGTADCGCFVTMEAVNITIGEFNDETIDLAITNSGSPFNLNSPQYGLQVLLKTAAGVLDNDPSTVILTSDGENPAITIAAGSNGLATLVIPHDVLETTAFTFWRCDVTTPSGQQATAIYGLVSIKML